MGIMLFLLEILQLFWTYYIASSFVSVSISEKIAKHTYDWWINIKTFMKKIVIDITYHVFFINLTWFDNFFIINLISSFDSIFLEAYLNFTSINIEEQLFSL